VAVSVPRLRPDLVVCYENAALHTFRAARRVGAVCVLDAASIHYQAARHWKAPQDPADPAFVEIAKQQEIDLADAILTCSRLAADTYRTNGVPQTKLHPTPLGTILPNVPRDKRSSDAAPRFVFVGSLIHRKGLSELLSAFEDLAHDRVPAELTLFGGAVERDLVAKARSLPNVVHAGFCSHDRLFAELATHDCLILPSLFDSFGMVVPEAMAVGVPAIVSERVGAKCIIEDHPEAGWIVPCDRAALKAQILTLVRHRELLDRASGAARQAAAAYTWENYRTRVVRTLEAVYEAHRH
jgi:glycosyltransferase involved in cell wall biosynthesis